MVLPYESNEFACQVSYEESIRTKGGTRNIESTQIERLHGIPTRIPRAAKANESETKPKVDY